MKNFLKGLWKNKRSSKVTNDSSTTIYDDDVFLVSYPKSGNTWVRFLIANLIKPPEQEIDFHSVHEQVPEWGKHDEIIGKLNRPRIIKSHKAYQEEYPRVIYIVRDGRDVYVSYYHHRLKELPKGTTFKEFLEREDHFPCLWHQHIESWLSKERHSNLDILTIKYEELKNDCLTYSKQMTNFIGLKTTEDQLKKAVEASSFQSMRNLELERGRLYNQGPEVFVRKGQPGNWREFFGEDEKAIFKQREGKTLMNLGYEPDNEW